MNRSQKLPNLKKGHTLHKQFPKTPTSSFNFPEKEGVHPDFSDDKEFHSIKAKEFLSRNRSIHDPNILLNLNESIREEAGKQFEMKTKQALKKTKYKNK